MGVQPCQAGEDFGVGAVVFAGVVIDRSQLAGVGDQDLVSQFFEQVAGPAGVRTDFHRNTRRR